MTVANAFRDLFKSLTGKTVEGKTVAQVVKNGSTAVAEKNEEIPKSIIIASSTADSTKKFEIKVVDNGTISATEIVETPPEGENDPPVGET